ncbi:MAG: phytanoyl-CoA dioxygenase family protein, partial [Chloroflexi bacterium]|nr:phytanoyl-CoA dioxygenase family protein [Chloroflexota bacterium]
MRTEPITPAEIKSFDDNGYLILRDVLHLEELRALQEDTSALIRRGLEQRTELTERERHDFRYEVDDVLGREMFYRVNYLYDKPGRSFLPLLAHPFILDLARRMVSEDFVPTWESMVFKVPGAGREIKWHCDVESMVVTTPHRIFNVDIYLDESDLENGCLLVIPQSHKPEGWETLKPAGIRAKYGYDLERGAPINMQAALMKPGDILLHSIYIVHGSPSTTSQRLRRVIYYEFRSASVILESPPKGGWDEAWIRKRLRLLHEAIRQRALAPYAAHDPFPFVYDPPAPWRLTT